MSKWCWAAVLALALFGLAACNGGSEKPADETPSATTDAGKTDGGGEATDGKETDGKEAEPAPTGAKLPSLPGLEYEDIEIGTGEAVVEAGDLLNVTYRGTLADGKEFDSNVAPEKDPFAFVVGAGSVIKGWDDGVLGMKKGGKRKLTIPAEFAYGDTGQGDIPPNATLFFEVTVLAIVKEGEGAIYDTEYQKRGTGTAVKEGDRVTVHYTGTLANGKKFDSSRDRNEPFAFTVGANEVIQAWDYGLRGKKVGDRFTLTAPPQIAYGASGRPPIPGNAVLIFDIEVLSVQPGTAQ